MKKTDKKIRSYGKFKEFEIRDVTRFDGHKLATEFDIVKWENTEDVAGKHYCYSIGFLRWNKKDETFKFESCGLRYLECATDELNEWLLKWCELKTFELRCENEQISRSV